MLSRRWRLIGCGEGKPKRRAYHRSLATINRRGRQCKHVDGGAPINAAKPLLDNGDIPQ
jgi:hypothetical protein